MKEILTVMKTISVSGPHPIVQAELQCSTVSDLPELYELVDGSVIGPGSVAELTQPGGFVKLDDDGKWYKADGSGEATEDDSDAVESLSMSPRLIGGVNQRQPATLQQNDEDEPEIVNVLPYEESNEEPEKDVNDDEELV